MVICGTVVTVRQHTGEFIGGTSTYLLGSMKLSSSGLFLAISLSLSLSLSVGEPSVIVVLLFIYLCLGNIISCNGFTKYDGTFTEDYCWTQGWYTSYKNNCRA